MRRFKSKLQMTLVLALAVVNGGCILIPQLKDRIVELAVGGTTSQVFAVQGSTTSVDETKAVNFGSELNLAQILSDAGIDVSAVTHISLASAAYRIVRADSDPSLEITNGQITIQRGAGPVDVLVTAFNAAPGAISGFQNIPLSAAGAATLNTLLLDIKNALPGAPTTPDVTFHLTGSSTGPTNFDFELKITVSITGTVKVKVPT